MTLVTKDARRCTRHVTCGEATLRGLKVAAHRRYRRETGNLVRQIADGRVDSEVADFTPSHVVDGRDVS